MGKKIQKNSAFFAMGFWILIFLVASTPTTILAAWQPSKPITIAVGAAPGGAMDTIARYAAQYLHEFLGSKQATLVHNFPGAGERAMFNLVRRSKPDGTTIGILQGDVLQQATAFKFIDYDPMPEITILGGIWTPPTCVLISATHPAVRANPQQTWEELKKVTKPVRIASYAQPGELALIPTLERNKIPYIVVPGYGGFRDASGGVLRGEADLLTGAGTMVPLQLLKDGKCAPLMVVSQERYKGMPEIGIMSFETAPTVVELGVPEFGKLRMDRMWFGPKSLPLEVEDALRAALKKLSEDPRTPEWSKKVGIPMTWLDKKIIHDAYFDGVAIYNRFSDVGKKIGLAPEQKK